MDKYFQLIYWKIKILSFIINDIIYLFKLKSQFSIHHALINILRIVIDFQEQLFHPQEFFLNFTQ